MHPGAIEARLRAGWTRRGVLAWLLLPLALIFGLLAASRRLLYRLELLPQSRVGRPVVVVGNLVVGGAGKTPLVLALIEALRARGRVPGVISRGHGGSGSAAGLLVAADTPASVAGDEACLIRRRGAVPVAIGRDRVAAARLLLAAHPQVDLIIADDGLQHLALARDVAVAVFDGRGAGNGWLLPAGPLREPLSRLATVDAVVVNGAAPDALPGMTHLSRSAPLTGAATPVTPVTPVSSASTGAAAASAAGAATGANAATAATAPPPPRWFGMQLTPAGAWQLVDPANQQSLSAFRDQNLLAVAGIGQPERFFATLSAAGLRFAHQALPDHHDFAGTTWPAHDGPIVMTEKDAVKCLDRDDPRLWAVRVAASVEPGLVDLILERVRGSATA